MPYMNWSPENDRILLLKLIETHAIHVNYAKIAEAWPKEAPVKPTAKAISERFLKIRKTVGQSGGVGGSTKSTPTTTPRARAPKKSFTTPASSSKKRKTKKVSEDSDSDDGEAHMTPSEDETPSKKPRNKTTPASARGAKSANAGNGTYIKTENIDDPFKSGEFAKVQQRAEQLYASRSNGYFDDASDNHGQYGMFDNSMGNGTGMYGSFANNHSNQPPMSIPSNRNLHAFTHPGFSGMDMGHMGGYNMDGMAGMNGSLQLPAQTSRLSISPQPNHGFATPSPRASFVRNHVPAGPSHASAGHSRASAAPSDESSSTVAHHDVRARSVRQASKQAAEGVSAFIKAQKEKDKADGERSTDEDSAESEFQGSDDDFV